SRIQTPVQSRVESGHVTGRREGCNQRYGLLFSGQGIGCGLCTCRGSRLLAGPGGEAGAGQGGLVVLVADLVSPGHRIAVLLLGNGDVGHRTVWACSMLMA